MKTHKYIKCIEPNKWHREDKIDEVDRKGWNVIIVNMGIREDLIQKVSFEQSSEEGESSLCAMWQTFSQREEQVWKSCGRYKEVELWWSALGTSWG